MVTEVIGLRLAYRGFVAGLAGGYVWAAIAMLLSGLAEGDPLRPLRPIALAFSPLASSPELAFVLGLAAIQGGGALIGMCFAYFFARFFTVRATLAIAAPVFTVLIWVSWWPRRHATGAASSSPRTPSRRWHPWDTACCWALRCRSVGTSPVTPDHPPRRAPARSGDHDPAATRPNRAARSPRC